MVQRAAQEGFIRAEHRELLLVDTDPGRILERLQNYEVPYVPKWVDREER
jgi:predicted Rossmann-fold nucleotide-binding protein